MDEAKRGGPGDLPPVDGGRLTFERTEEMLRGILGATAEAPLFEYLHLDREAAAAFIAEQATLLSAVAHASGLSTVKIIADLLYVNAFSEAKLLDHS
jgi:hypothetical protein